MYYNQTESGKRIKQLRINRGLTQEQLSSNLNIATSTLGNIERGKRGISIDLAIEIAILFNVSLDYLLLGREMQTDGIRKQVHQMIDQLLEMEKRL